MQFISWEQIHEYIFKKIPAQLPVSVSSEICFLVANEGDSFGLRVPISETSEINPSPYRELDIHRRTIQDQNVIELTVNNPALYNTFYYFCIEILQLIINEGVDGLKAIQSCVTNWSKLLLQKGLLEESAQIGLTGELCLLKALIIDKGIDAFEAWTGPLKGRHDFKFGNSEIEVKSTIKSKRVHVIHGLSQLELSDGMDLYIFSLQFELAGQAKTGKTLVERINEIRNLLSIKKSTLNKFNLHIENLGYKDADANFYMDKFKLRSSPLIIPIDSKFPKLTKSILNKVMSGEIAARIEDVQYEVSVEGLGYPEGSEEYEKIMQGIALLESIYG